MAAESKKFKVGDKVISTVNTPTTPEGFVGYVTDINDFIEEYDYSVENRGVWPGRVEVFKEHELELLSVSQVARGVVKSDGGSSSYYELTITNKAGESIKCETGDVIRALVGNDFDFGNCVKALRRMYLATLGMGKEGTNIPYDCNKVRYFLSEIERVNK